MDFLAAEMMALQNFWYVSPILEVSADGRFLAELLMRELYCSQSAFRKFHLFTGLLGLGAISRDVLMSEGRC